VRDTTFVSSSSIFNYKPAHHINLKTDKPLEMDAKVFPASRYQAYQEIGQGASGTVYLCFDTILAKEVAVKCLHELSPEQFVSFQAEAKITSSLQNSNIIQVMDFGATESGAPYMVMEYFPGTPLSTILREHGSLDSVTCISLFIPVLEALEHSHEQRFFHRDIKPSNILVLQNENSFDVRVIDFGVAVAKQGTQEPTIVNGKAIAGTPLYMPPDQVSGLAYTAASEVYSVGCVLFECLSGQRPFDGETPLDVLTKHAKTPPPVLYDLVTERSSLVGHLSEIVARCLEKNPADRFHSIAELKDALLGLRAEAAELQRRRRTETEMVIPKIAEPAKKQVRKPVLIAVALVLVTGAALALQHLAVPTHEKTAHHKGVLNVAKLRQQREALFRTSPELFFDRVGIDHYVPRKSFDFSDEDLACMRDPDMESQNLDLSSCSNVTGVGLKYLTPSKIQYLDLSTSGLNSDGVTQLAKLSSLKALNLEDTKISSNDLTSLSELDKLTDLDIGGCAAINDKGLESLKGFDNLSTLYIDRSKITDNGLKTLGTMKSLSTLNLDRTDISDAGMQHVLSLPKIYHLRLGSSPKITAKTLTALISSHPELQRLSCCFISIKPTDLDCLKDAKNLIALVVMGVDVGDRGLELLSGLSDLQELYLGNLTCKPESLKKLYSMKNLRTFNVTKYANATEAAVTELKERLPNCEVTIANQNSTTGLSQGVKESMDLFLDSEEKTDAP